MRLSRLILVILSALWLAVAWWLLAGDVKSAGIFGQGVRVGRTADLYFTDGVAKVIPWTIEGYDDANFHSLTVNNTRLTMPREGTYTAVASTSIAGMGTSNVTMQVRIMKNATENVGMSRVAWYPGAPLAGLAQTVVGGEKLVAGDYLEVWVTIFGAASSYLQYTGASFTVLEVIVGGDNVSVPLVFPIEFYVLVAGLVLLIIGIWNKSPILKIALALCMVDIAFSQNAPFVNTWLQTAAAAIAIWASISAWARFDENMGGF